MPPFKTPLNHVAMPRMIWITSPSNAVRIRTLPDHLIPRLFHAPLAYIRLMLSSSNSSELWRMSIARERYSSG